MPIFSGTLVIFGLMGGTFGAMLALAAITTYQEYIKKDNSASNKQDSGD